MNKLHGFCISMLVFLSGCSSVIEGRSQEIVINTNPPGASCVLVRNNMPIGTVSPTPSAILIEKTKYDITVKCDKDGYQQASYFDKSDAAGATVGNIILGGGIGWAIDSATGADNKYDSPLNITMIPNEMAAAGHAHHAQVSAVQPSTGVPVASADAQAQQTGDQGDFPSARNGGR